MSLATERSTPRSRRRTAKVGSILDAALRVMEGEGLDALTMARMASELDYTPGALYRYYPSKEAILAAVQARLLGGLSGALEAAWAELGPRCSAAEPGLTALAEILAAVVVYAELPSVAPVAFALLNTSLADPRELVDRQDAEPVAAAMGELLGAIAVRVAAAAGSEALEPDVDGRRAVVLWAAVHGQLMVKKLSRFQPVLFEPAALARAAVDGLLRGWGAPVGSLEAAWSAVDSICTRERVAAWVGAHVGVGTTE